MDKKIILSQLRELNAEDTELIRMSVDFVLKHGTDEHVQELKALNLQQDRNALIRLTIKVNHHAFGGDVPAARDANNNIIE